MASNLSKKIGLQTAKNFKDSFSRVYEPIVGYVFIGKSTPYLNEPTPDTIFDSDEYEKLTWDNSIAGKKVTESDMELVVPRIDWTSNTIYKQYDDTKTLNYLLSETEESGNTIHYPMYVITSERNVYKCICNDVATPSTIEPTGNYSENDGFINTADGYLWKYMYNIKPSNKFLSDDWMPAPFVLVSKVTTNDYDLSANNLIQGSLNKIIVGNRGSGYFDTVINVEPFITNSNTLVLSNASFDLSSSNIKINMLVTGNGILSGTYITNISNATSTLTLSENTIGPGGGPNTTILISTRIEIEGDGTETSTSVSLANGEIRKITVDSAGTGYTRANVFIYGSGSGANARVVLPPKLGHGYNPSIELVANNIMIVKLIGEVDSTENNLIPVGIDFRQYGLLINPYKYSETEPVLFANANTVVSLTTDVSLLSGSPYEKNEFVYQGNFANPSFSGYVTHQTLTIAKLTQVSGNLILGSILTGSNSSISRPVVSVEYPDLEFYTGDILYTSSIEKTERSLGQAEQIRLVFQF